MPTEEDLRAALRALEQGAPDLGGTLAGCARRRARRRTTVMVAVAAGTLALVASTLAAPTVFRQPAEPNRYVDGRWVFRFAVDPIPGTRVEYSAIGKDYDSAAVRMEGQADPSWVIMVFHPGVYDPAGARRGTPLDVAGKPGFYRDEMPCMCNAAFPYPGLVWEYAPNSWAYVSPTPTPRSGDDDLARLLAVARAVRTDRTTPLRVPFRIGYLPGGLVAGTGGTGSDTTVYAKLTSTEPGRAELGISTRPTAGSTTPVGVPTASIDAAGSHLVLNLGLFVIELWSGNRGRALPVEELTRLARSITPAGSYVDPSTWIPAYRAIPTG